MQRLIGKLALLLIVVGALALAGCGGDDGLSAEDQARIDQAEADRQAAEEARQAAERQAEADREAAAAAERERQAAEAEAERERQAELDRQADEEAAETERLAAIRMALAAIAAAETAADADAAYAAVVAQATFAEGQQLMQAVANRKTALATMARAAAQMMALSDAAGMLDTSDLTAQGSIDAANTAIAALEMALTAAADVSDADKAMYMNQVAAAKAAVATAQMALDRGMQMTALTAALDDVTAISLTDLDTQAKIDALNAAITALQAALAGADDLTDADKTAAMAYLSVASQAVMTAQNMLDHSNEQSQMMALTDAATALGEIDLSDLGTQDKIDAANTAIMALQAALDAATHLSDAQKANATADVTVAKRRVASAQTALADNMEAQRTALSEAAGMVDTSDLSTQEAVNAASAAVAALKAALDGATHLSDADKAMYMTQLAMAETAVMTAQSMLDHTAQLTALTTAVSALQAIDLSDLDTQAKIDAADAAVAGLQAALETGTALSDAEKATAMVELAAARRTVMAAVTALQEAEEAARIAELAAGERTVITDALAAAQEAVAMVMDDSEDDVVMAADAAVAAVRAAISAAANVPDGEKAVLTAALTTLAGQLAGAKADRQTAMRLAAEEADRQEQARQAEEARLAKIQEAKDTIAAATTATQAQAAYDSAVGDATPAEAAELRTALDARMDALAMMARAEAQRTALMTAAGNVDTSGMMTAEEIAAANTAIAALKAALAAATDVSDADKAMYQAMVDVAEANVMASQTALNHAAQMTALANALTALRDDVDLSDLDTQDKVDAADAAIAALEMALTAATALSDAEKLEAMTELSAARRIVTAAKGRVDVAGQMAALSAAHMALQAINLNDLMTQDDIDAANAAIVALDLALEGATGLTAAEKLDATVAVTLAKRSVTAAQTALDTNIESQRMALTDAGTDLSAIDLEDLDTAEKIAAAKTAVEALKMALDGATHLSDADKAMYQSQYMTASEEVKMAETGMNRMGRMAAQRTEITNTVATATTAVGAVNDTATDEQVTAADNAIAALEAAIEGADDLPEGDTDVATAKGTLATLKMVLASAKTSRTAAMEAAETERKRAEQAEKDRQNAAMAATAAKLYMGISARVTGTTGGNIRDAAYSGTGESQITVSIGGFGADGTTPLDPVPTVILSEDKKTTVADNHGWEGKRYTDPAGGDMVEAIVYSNVEEPKMGKKFGDTTSGLTATSAYQYQLNAAGALTADEADGIGETTNAFVSARIALTGVTRTAGTETFELPEGRPQGETIINVPGSYHGVSGTYNCDTGTGAANTCMAVVAGGDGGFTLSGTGTWTFKPSNAESRVMESADTIYASYGWWLKKAANDGPFTASAFTDEKGEVAVATGLDTLNGTATYMGGAAGKYALSSATGGTNDAGHFTARAMLEADFTNNTDAAAITGTIDMFIGGDGQSRDWEVELKGSPITDGGVIGNDGSSTASPGGTVWTIGDVDAEAGGSWAGVLRNSAAEGAGGVPQVATGTFYSVYGTAGKMVGAFGANVQ